MDVGPLGGIWVPGGGGGGGGVPLYKFRPPNPVQIGILSVPEKGSELIVWVTYSYICRGGTPPLWVSIPPLPGCCLGINVYLGTVRMPPTRSRELVMALIEGSRGVAKAAMTRTREERTCAGNQPFF